jgi:PAS domain S-box-containing protein
MDADRFREVADHFPQAALLLRKDGTVVAANRSVSALGWSPEDLQGKALYDLAATPAELVADFLRLCSRSREPLIGSLDLLVLGAPAACRCSGKLIQHDPTGAESRLLMLIALKDSTPSEFAILNQKLAALNEEIRRRRHLEERLREQSEWLAVTLSSIGDGVITTDQRGRATFLNPMAEKLTGWGTDEARGRPLEEIFEIVNEHTREVVENPVHKVLETGLVVGLANHTILIAKDGREIPIDDSGAPIRNEEGLAAGVVLIFRDVSERKKTEDDLRLASRRKDEFLAMLAHELRNPLAPIRSGLDLLALCDADPEVVGPMQRQVEHLVRLVDDLLDVSRIMRNVVELRKAPVELAAVVKRAVETIQTQIQARRQSLTIRLPSKPVELVADQVRLTQSIANLLHNASKYNDEGGEISLSAHVESDEAVISVRDDGWGIDAELLPHVFELFTQEARSIDRSQGGLGIGLTVVKTLVELHGGTATATSEGRGRGSEFTIRLPAVGVPAAPASETKASVDGSSRRILIVDDNVPAATMLAKLLRKLGPHQIAVAHDGLAALEMAKRFDPQIVFLDIGLPRLDGYEVAKALRRDPDFERTLIVALTGYGSEENRRDALQAGCDEHLVKPPGVSDILRALSHPKLPTVQASRPTGEAEAFG